MSHVLFDSIAVYTDPDSLENRLRWHDPELGEEDPKIAPVLPTWEPLSSAGSLEFEIDPDRLANPAFENGILFSSADFRLLADKVKADSALGNFWSILEGQARRLLQNGRLDLAEESAGRLTYKVRVVSNLSLLYAATGEPHLGALLRQLILDVADRPMHFWVHSELRKYDRSWPVGQLECAELSRSLTLATIWSRDLFSDEEYAHVLSSIRNKGLDPSMRWLEGPGKVQRSNYLAVIGGGALVTAIALEEEQSALIAIEGLKRWLELVEDDGSYGEPQGYFEYACSRFFFGWWALGHERGKQLLQDSALKGSLDWIVSYFILAEHNGTKSALRVNFGNDDFLTGPHGNTTFTRMVSESLAYTYEDGLGTWISQELIHPDTPINIYEFLFRLSQAGSTLPEPVSPSEKELPLARSFDNGVTVIRSNWKFDDSTLFALRSGGASKVNYAHDHHNRNAFVLFSHGEYLAVESGRASYRSSLHKTWDIPSFAKNTISLDDVSQTKDREAVICEFVDTPEYVKVVSEGKGAYASKPESMLRTIWYIKALDAFLIEDQVRLSVSQVPSWHLLLSNFQDESTLDALPFNGWKLQRAQANLAFWLSADHDLELRKQDGYMHSGYSYYPGGQYEGKLGSAFSMTWKTSDKVDSASFYSLLIPSAGSDTPQVECSDDGRSWTILSANEKTVLSLQSFTEGQSKLSITDAPTHSESL